MSAAFTGGKFGEIIRSRRISEATSSLRPEQQKDFARCTAQNLVRLCHPAGTPRNECRAKWRRYRDREYHQAIRTSRDGDAPSARIVARRRTLPAHILPHLF